MIKVLRTDSLGHLQSSKRICESSSSLIPDVFIITMQGKENSNIPISRVADYPCRCTFLVFNFMFMHVQAEFSWSIRSSEYFNNAIFLCTWSQQCSHPRACVLEMSWSISYSMLWVLKVEISVCLLCDRGRLRVKAWKFVDLKNGRGEEIWGLKSWRVEEPWGSKRVIQQMVSRRMWILFIKGIWGCKRESEADEFREKREQSLADTW